MEHISGECLILTGKTQKLLLMSKGSSWGQPVLLGQCIQIVFVTGKFGGGLKCWQRERRFQGYSRIDVMLKMLLLLPLAFAPSVACSEPRQLSELVCKIGWKWMVTRFKLSSLSREPKKCFPLNTSSLEGSVFP